MSKIKVSKKKSVNAEMEERISILTLQKSAFQKIIAQLNAEVDKPLNLEGSYTELKKSFLEL